ncbi:hypothetical protein DTO013E5_6617 [Penicillium roqueforti]|uniref:uncharacterized protein n=1 Tax=Penicillium roqueforti TaxID=5082 RepID=UPI00190BE0B3|nr:uncharacterized protein LCP9604111_6719 [Penicillium roqueforti]KAF9246047.1 hypothetical protein LCP9604111_6719 [Penicillium roqueforti]KAI1834477.1 hypothetical protein CBS147337_4767 [Penicillium roqueforti]KAI2685997.1 hypothetical protein CBS147355_1484 [Penicillium roqueforti]KAI2692210.1 hypothetical protein LCP963914a_304 [Penicillium roqueforti]KAI2705185.1 hypothetical protein CBS147372_1488 [Penicillium roqueforti]
MFFLGSMTSLTFVDRLRLHSRLHFYLQQKDNIQHSGNCWPINSVAHRLALPHPSAVVSHQPPMRTSL